MLPKQPNESVIHAIKCLEYVVASESPCAARGVAKDLGMEPTKAHRLLRTLASMGLLHLTPKRKYVAGPGVAVLAALALRGNRFIGNAIPALEKLRKDSRHLVAMGALWMKQVSYIYHAGPNAPLESAIGNHPVWPASASGLGIALLAQLEDAGVRSLYREDREIPNHPGGITSLLRVLAEVRESGFAFYRTGEKEHHRTLAIPLASNPSIGIAFSGPIRPAEIPGLLAKLRSAASSMDSRQG